MRRLLCAVVLGISLVSLPAPVSATTIDTRTPLYFADWTTSDWPILDAVVRWNKNDKIRLKQVKACETWMRPCVTITSMYDHEYFAHKYGGYYAANEADRAASDSKIVLLDWIDETVFPDLRYDMRRNIVCHELGHYIFGDGKHWDRGCMGAYVTPFKPNPGKYNRSIIPSWTGGN